MPAPNVSGFFKAGIDGAKHIANQSGDGLRDVAGSISSMQDELGKLAGGASKAAGELAHLAGGSK